MKIFVLDAINRKGLEILGRHPGTVLWDDPRIVSWREEADGIILRGNTVVSAADMARAPHLKAISKHGTGVDQIDLERRPGPRHRGHEHARAQRRRGFGNGDGDGARGGPPGGLRRPRLALGQGAAAGRHRRQRRRHRRPQHGRQDRRRSSASAISAAGSRNAGGWRSARRCSATIPRLPASAWSGLGCERVERLDDLLPRADLVSIHVPLTPETRHFIGARQLALMKPSAILVNLARGGVVDEDALYEALAQQRIFGAALDVFEQEPPVGHRLFTLAQLCRHSAHRRRHHRFARADGRRRGRAARRLPQRQARPEPGRLTSTGADC